MTTLINCSVCNGLLTSIGTYKEQTYSPVSVIVQEESGPVTIITGMKHNLTAIKMHLFGSQICPGSKTIIEKILIDP